MIYGRRLFDKSHEGPFYKKPAHRVFRVLNSQFQWKYTLSLMAFLLVSMSFFMIPSWYFLLQNYGIFNRLARIAEPQLLQHLSREMMWLFGFSLFSVLSLVAVTIWVGLKLTANIIGPLISMERHLWKVTTGDWSSPDFKIRAEDDFRDLAEAYSYFYRSMKAQAESELALLEKVHIDPEHRDAFNALHSLIDLKKKQMNLVGHTAQLIPLIPVSASEVHDSRRAS